MFRLYSLLYLEHDFTNETPIVRPSDTQSSAQLNNEDEAISVCSTRTNNTKLSTNTDQKNNEQAEEQDGLKETLILDDHQSSLSASSSFSITSELITPLEMLTTTPVMLETVELEYNESETPKTDEQAAIPSTENHQTKFSPRNLFSRARSSFLDDFSITKRTGHLFGKSNSQEPSTVLKMPDVHTDKSKARHSFKLRGKLFSKKVKRTFSLPKKK